MEKDWVISIAEGNDRRLAALNVSLRRVDLLCNLVAPLLVSYLLVAVSYRAAALALALVTITGLAFELSWIGVVYERFPQLQDDDAHKIRTAQNNDAGSVELVSCSSYIGGEPEDWIEFVRLPVFLSSLSISLLYVTVLSYVCLLLKTCHVPHLLSVDLTGTCSDI